MRLLFGFIAGLILIASLAVAINRLRSDNEKDVASTQAASISAYSHTDAPLGNLVTDHGPVTITGTAIMDYSTGLPAVPYIKYIGRNDAVWTKQLIFDEARGCAPSAADIPCVPGYPQKAAYPQISTGQSITVEGYIRDNRFLVERMSIDQ
jgi:hypothetical protein